MYVDITDTNEGRTKLLLNSFTGLCKAEMISLKGKVFDPGRKSTQITVIIHLKSLCKKYQQTPQLTQI